ncbi:Putative Proline dehydrogenase-like protein [[Torrubiella] hemipterigena]|uniref:Proline dehydrogenase n=1 Tax=[Torrubiella] hemipterigena TaxID=1531966 RepID=A0A0A1TB81_9HYPO|nr:Putative Proline dehydrogenase-like protein [[Torrubiella] hemipterigena]
MHAGPARGLALLPVHRATSSSGLLLAAALSGHGRLARHVAPRAVIGAAASQARLIHSSKSDQIHSSERKESTIAEIPGASPIAAPQEEQQPRNAPLSVLPLSMIVRSFATTVVSSSPTLLPPSLVIMNMLAHTTNPLFNPDKNPILRYFLKKTFYAQFCAGEDAAEVRHTIAKLKNIEGEITPWADGTLTTVGLAEPGDYVALKFTGAGRLALTLLSKDAPPTPFLSDSIDAICKLAHERGVRLLFDAEQDALQPGIDSWTIQYARKYNTDPSRATIYGTYQAYKKCTPSVLSGHLALAQKEGFTVGVKLVRGAYIGSDPREVIHDTKEQTDACYDGIAASILTRQFGSTITGEGQYPNTHLVVASHNVESVRRARAICDTGMAKSTVSFAQLQGMADEVSCELVEASASTSKPAALPVYKYLVWGTTGECMKYLLRRAQENKDAVARTRSGRDAMWAELVRRFKATFTRA